MNRCRFTAPPFIPVVVVFGCCVYDSVATRCAHCSALVAASAVVTGVGLVWGPSRFDQSTFYFTLSTPNLVIWSEDRLASEQ